MNHAKRRQRIDQLRKQSLTNILKSMGAEQDRHDKSKWNTTRGTLTITGEKFFNWNTETGGGGAIDLIIHLKQCRFNEALSWLEDPAHIAPKEHTQAIANNRPFTRSSLAIPSPHAHNLSRIKTYLTQERQLELSILQPHFDNGTLYADVRANAVFLHQSSEGTTIGAELRGTTQASWRGLAPGTRKDQGYFTTPPNLIEKSPIILCESAIDAISCSVLHPGHECRSTAGARANPVWLGALLKENRPIYCGYDTDIAGEQAALTMMSLHPSIKRQRPANHDWNEDLKHLH